MKPLFMINAAGPSLPIVLGSMIHQCNALLKSVDGIRFVETIHNAELNALRQPVANVIMIFEMDNEYVREEIQRVGNARPEMIPGLVIPLQ